MWEGGLSDESEGVEEAVERRVRIMMLSEEFVAGRVFEGDARRAEEERELVRRRREQRAQRRAERVAERAGRSTPAASAVSSVREPLEQPLPEAAAEAASEAGVGSVAEPQRELAHAGR
jgi:hypothetical protein